MKKIGILLQQCLCIVIAATFFTACSKETLNNPNNAISNQNSTARLTTSSEPDMPPPHSIAPKVDFSTATNGFNVEFTDKSTGGSNYVISDMTFEFGDRQIFTWNADNDKTPCPTKIAHTYTQIPFIGYRVTLTITLRDNITGIDAGTLSVSRLLQLRKSIF